MAHPSLGMPPPDVTAGSPVAAARLREHRERLARLSLEATLRLAPHFRERYDEIALRQLLRDFDRHIEQTARALETGDDHWATNYGEWLVPVYRRRGVPMKDFIAMLAGMRDAALTVLPPEDATALRALVVRWADRLKHHGRLAGDHKGNPIVRFFWKGAGIGDDSVV